MAAIVRDSIPASRFFHGPRQRLERTRGLAAVGRRTARSRTHCGGPGSRRASLPVSSNRRAAAARPPSTPNREVKGLLARTGQEKCSAGESTRLAQLQTARHRARKRSGSGQPGISPFRLEWAFPMTRRPGGSGRLAQRSVRYVLCVCTSVGANLVESAGPTMHW
jgi:hypothetical protein